MKLRNSSIANVFQLLLAAFILLAFAGSGGHAQATSERAKIDFKNVTKSAGITFVHMKGSQGVSTILEEIGPGVCVADYDNDGFQDIYFVNGRDLYHHGIKASNALYHNNGDGTFTDVTNQAHVPGSGYGLGCAWGDFDNDGFPDLYVTQYGKNVLYHNNGDGTFSDVTDRAGVGGTELGTMFHSAATFFDYDRDGWLDLYVGGYAKFGPASPRNCDIGGGVMSPCLPVMYGGTPDVLYRNNRDGTFKEVTRISGVYKPGGINLAVQAGDFDNDGWPDLFVANDGIDASLFRNRHDGTFEDEAAIRGMARAEGGVPMSGMSVSLGDYDNDGFLDLFISDFQSNPDHLWHNNGKGYFDEVSSEAGVGEPTRQVLSFGGGFIDYDNDGWLDLFIANGHIYPDIEQISTTVHYKQLNSLFHNERNGRFTRVTSDLGDGFDTPYAARGAAFADLDNDGNMDIVVTNNGDPPLLLKNLGPTENHFVNFKLVGTKSNRDAMGARVTIRTGSLSQIREVAGGGSFLSQSDLRVHFGLGETTLVDSLEVKWPSGKRQVFRKFPADKFYLIKEDANIMQLQKFIPHRLIPSSNFAPSPHS